MSEDIQGLLERIQTEGIQKAEAAKQQILEDARRQADAMLEEAKREAEMIRKAAQEEAAISESKGKAAVKQAARDVLLSLQADLQKRLEAITRDSLGEALTPEVLGRIIVQMAEKYLSGTEGDLEVLLSAGDAAALESGLKAGLLADLKRKPEIMISSNLSSGLKIGIKGTDLFFDFSDDALTDVICSFAGPKLAAAIKD